VQNSLFRGAEPVTPPGHRCEECGIALPASARTGRPRITCSEVCRRRRDFRHRKIARRRTWLELWRAEEGARPPAEIRREMRHIESDIRALQRRRAARR